VDFDVNLDDTSIYMADTDAAGVNDGGLPPAASAPAAVSAGAPLKTAATSGGGVGRSTVGFAGGLPATTGEYPSANSDANGHTPTLGGFTAIGRVGGSLTTGAPLSTTIAGYLATTGDATPTVSACTPATSGTLGMPTIIDCATTANHGPYGMFARLIRRHHLWSLAFWPKLLNNIYFV